MNFKGIILAVLLPLGFFGALTVSAFDITPATPVKGDVISLSDSCTPRASIPVKLEFTRIIPVSGGEYVYEVGTLEIPSGTTLSVRAENVKDMKLVKYIYGFPITITVDGSGGVASFGTGIISGKNTLKVYGDALLGVDSVSLRFTAATSVDCDDNGTLVYTYNTVYLPLGSYTISVGGVKQDIELLAFAPPPDQGPSPTPTATPAPTPAPEANFYLVANDIDFGLNEGLIDDMGAYGLFGARSRVPQGCTLILGGPDAYDGVGDIARRFLDDDEESLIREIGGRGLFNSGGVIIVAGMDRGLTKSVFEDRFIEVVANLHSCVDRLG